MQTQKKEPVEFIKERDFGELIGAPFYFFFQEFKKFSSTLLRYAGPYIAVAILGMALVSNNFYQAVDSDSNLSTSVILFILISGIFMMIGYISAIVITHSYISLYVKQGKDNFTMEEVGQLYRRNFFKVFGAGFLVYFIVMAGFIFFWIPGIYFSYALTFFSITIVYEEITAGESISRSFQVVKGEWWQTFAIIFIFGMIVGFMAYAFIIPIYIVVFASVITGSSITGGAVLGIIISLALLFVGSLFLTSLQQMIIVFQYFSILTKKQEPSLMDRISDITNEEENKPDIFKEVDTIEEHNENNDEDDQNRFNNDDDPNRFKPKY